MLKRNTRMVSLRYTHANQLHFLTEKTNEQIAGEYPEGIKQIGHWKNVFNGNDARLFR